MVEVEMVKSVQTQYILKEYLAGIAGELNVGEEKDRDQWLLGFEVDHWVDGVATYRDR